MGWSCDSFLTYLCLNCHKLTLSNLPNQLLAVPICNVPVNVRTTATALFWFWRKTLKCDNSQESWSSRDYIVSMVSKHDRQELMRSWKVTLNSQICILFGFRGLNTFISLCWRCQRHCCCCICRLCWFVAKSMGQIRLLASCCFQSTSTHLQLFFHRCTSNNCKSFVLISCSTNHAILLTPLGNPQTVLSYHAACCSVGHHRNRCWGASLVSLAGGLCCANPLFFAPVHCFRPRLQGLNVSKQVLFCSFSQFSQLRVILSTCIDWRGWRPSFVLAHLWRVLSFSGVLRSSWPAQHFSGSFNSSNVRLLYLTTQKHKIPGRLALDACVSKHGVASWSPTTKCDEFLHAKAVMFRWASQLNSSSVKSVRALHA